MNVEINVRKNDRVVVIAGKDRGKTGRVLEVHPRKRKVLVEGVNVVKRHNKANARSGVQGGIVERESPIDVSNVMVMCPTCGQATRAGHQVLTDGTRTRACKKCGAAIEKQ
ncbi:MAG TPA: 50S ribosomal protein L24 [Blastocatellia bacterium]|nr:50S ribosomal protein L24 [Blastocatellia bacterium]